jgi:hypothetical protein
MARIEKKMIGATFVVGIGLYVLVNSSINQGVSAYDKHKLTTDTRKKICLDQHKTIDYEVVLVKIYCKTPGGLVETKK